MMPRNSKAAKPVTTLAPDTAVLAIDTILAIYRYYYAGSPVDS